MSTERPIPAKLARALHRELGTIGTQSVLLNQAIADRLGLYPTEVEVLDLLSRAGSLTAGDVARVTGLTSGAASRLIDRLERAGYARRAPHPQDRRSVLVMPVAESIGRELVPLVAPLEQALSACYGRYDEAQLGLIVEFLSRVNAITREHIARLRSRPPDNRPNSDKGEGP
ncbi:MAG TPA: MarR family transcriptional regulator [Limnochordia bacterium]